MKLPMHIANVKVVLQHHGAKRIALIHFYMLDAKYQDFYDH